ncbi:MAG: hypothetical protein ACLQDQ_08925 [Myxococcaceae bacterium]
MMLGPLSLALALLAAPASVDAGPVPPRISPEVSAEKVRLGEPFTYTLSVMHSPDERWELRTPADLGAFGLRSSARQRVDGKGQSTTTFRLELALFELGEHELPTLVFDVVGGGAPRTASVAGARVEGLSSLPPDAAQNGAQLMDIKPNADVPVRSWRLLWLLLALAVLIALALWVRRSLANRRARLPPAPPRPLPERTREALEALRAEGLLGRGLVREYHFRLSDIVRGYLGERFAFEALECTSGELLREVERLDPPGVNATELQRFVDQCDVAKFARAEISVSASEWALGYAFTLVETTTPPPSLEPVDAV